MGQKVAPISRPDSGQHFNYQLYGWSRFWGPDSGLRTGTAKFSIFRANFRPGAGFLAAPGVPNGLAPERLQVQPRVPLYHAPRRKCSTHEGQGAAHSGNTRHPHHLLPCQRIGVKVGQTWHVLERGEGALFKRPPRASCRAAVGWRRRPLYRPSLSSPPGARPLTSP